MTNPNDPNQPPYGQQPGQQPYGAPGGQPYPQQPYGQQPPAKKRRKWPWIILAVVVVFIIIAVATQGGEDSTSTTAASTSSQPEGQAEGQAPPAAEDVEEGSTTIPPLVPAAPSGEGKQITYEVISDSATLNNVTWFDENSALQQESSVAAPWSLQLSNASTVSIIGVTAQTDGQSVTCRVIVDGEVEAEETATGQYAVVNCTANPF